MRRTTFLDQTHQRNLERQGFTIVQLVADDEVTSVLERIQALTPSDRFAPSGDAILPATYHCTFLDTDTTYKRAVDSLMREVFEERTCSMLDRFRMLTSNLYVKPPGVGRFEVHQNWPVTADIRDTTLTLWCPFVDVGVDNGTIHVVPGSHKIVPDIFTVGAPKYFASFYDELIDHWLEPVELRAGECILFDDSLLHWSDINRSDSWRWSAQLVFMPEEATPLIFHYDAEHEPPQFEMYEVDPEFFISSGVDQLIQRPTVLEFTGTIPENNVDLSEADFADVMQHGQETRELVYAGEPVERAFARALQLDRKGAAPPEDLSPDVVELPTSGSVGAEMHESADEVESSRRTIGEAPQGSPAQIVRQLADRLRRRTR